MDLRPDKVRATFRMFNCECQGRNRVQPSTSLTDDPNKYIIVALDSQIFVASYVKHHIKK